MIIGLGNSMHAIEIDCVTKNFGNFTAVGDLSLNVPAGSIYGFIGPNGSGKTTTLRMVMRILHPDTGRIRVLDEENISAANDQVGYLPEERGLYKKMKVADLLVYFAALKGCRDQRTQVDRWLEQMELSEWADKRVEVLSKGMSQKVQFIVAVVAKPRLLILDEPFSGLDPVNSEVIKNAIIELKKQGTTIVFSTHDMDVAENMCDFIFMIHKGCKVIDGTLESIQDNYGSDVVRVRLQNDVPIDLTRIEGVEQVTDFGRLQELRIRPGTDSQQVLTQLMDKGQVRHFELARPSLRDIFIRIAGPESEG